MLFYDSKQSVFVEVSHTWESDKYNPLTKIFHFNVLETVGHKPRYTSSTWFDTNNPSKEEIEEMVDMVISEMLYSK